MLTVIVVGIHDVFNYWWIIITHEIRVDIGTNCLLLWGCMTFLITGGLLTHEGRVHINTNCLLLWGYIMFHTK